MTAGAPIRRWALWLLLPTLAFGVFAGVLMTWHHETQLYGEGGDLIGCSESATISCDTVNTSSWSEVVGVPLATWAVATYVTLGVLVVLALRGRRGALSLLVIAGATMTVFSAILFYVSKTQIGFLCAWCLRLYLVNVATLVLSIVAARPSLPDRGSVLRGAAVFATAAAVSVIAQRVYRGSLVGDVPTAAVTPEQAHVEHDPTTPAPAREIKVTTEDGRQATLAIAPEDAWKGNPQARVTVVEFGDFQCGHCRRASGELKRVFEQYGDRALFVFKHYPLDPACNPNANNLKHILACPAARAAVCAREQGKFWAFHDLVYEQQKDLSVDMLRANAEHIGLDMPTFDACVGDDRSLQLVRSGGETGKNVDVHGTPRIFVNGTLNRAATADAIGRAIERALAGETP